MWKDVLSLWGQSEIVAVALKYLQIKTRTHRPEEILRVLWQRVRHTARAVLSFMKKGQFFRVFYFYISCAQSNVKFMSILSPRHARDEPAHQMWKWNALWMKFNCQPLVPQGGLPLICSGSAQREPIAIEDQLTVGQWRHRRRLQLIAIVHGAGLDTQSQIVLLETRRQLTVASCQLPVDVEFW